MRRDQHVNLLELVLPEMRRRPAVVLPARVALSMPNGPLPVDRFLIIKHLS